MVSSEFLVFTLLPLISDKLIIARPEGVEEAFITSEFQDNLNNFQIIDPKWPQNYQRMQLLTNKTGSIFVHEELTNRTFMRYQIRFFYSNRTYVNSNWTYVVWKPLLYTNYYGGLITMLILFFLLLTANVIFIFKNKILK